MTRVLGVDPGGTTGWALLDTVTREGSGGVVKGHEWEHIDLIVGWVLDGVCDVLVLEDFHMREDLHGGAKLRDVTLSPVRINLGIQYTLYREVCRQGELRRRGWKSIAEVGEKELERAWATEVGGGKVVKQSSSDAKRFATDDRLRRWGLYVTPEHARDAMRHAVLYAARHPSGGVREGSRPVGDAVVRRGRPKRR